MTMHLHVKLFASLGHLTPADAHRFPVPSGQNVEELLDTLGIPIQQVQLVFVNGIKKDMTATLKDGDRVGIFPPIGGG